MGLVLNNEDIKLQDLVYLETDIWRNELSKIYGDKKVDERNKRELEIFEENPYEWVKIALSRKIDRINNKDLSDIEKSSRKKALDNLLDKKRLLIERLNNIKLALDKKIPLEVNGEMRSDWVNLDNGKSLDVEVATDDINKLVGKESLNYSVVGIVIRGKEKYIVVKNEKGERVELKMEDAERLAEETSIEFRKNKEKEKKLEDISIGDIVKIRTGGLDGERAIYKIREVRNGKISFENLTTNQKGNMSIEDMRSFLMDKNKEFVVEKSEEYKNKQELKSLENFGEKIEELKIRQTIGRRKASPEEKAKLWKEQLSILGFGNVEIQPAGQVEDTEENEKIEKEKLKRLETMREIGDILRKNNMKVDRVVIHGYSFENEKGELLSHWDADSDTRGALYMLQLAGVKYNLIEKTHKGEGVEQKPGEVIIYIDTNNKTLSVEHENGGVQINFDHHQKNHPGDNKTSATKETYDTMLENGFIERDLKLDRLTNTINQEDNLSYVDNKRFNESYFKYKYASSLFALQKEVDFRHLIQWSKEGRDPFDPKFTDKELEEKVKILVEAEGWQEKGENKPRKMYREEMVPLKFVIGEIQKKIDSDLKAFEFAKRKMKERVIKEYTNELGKVIYNFPDYQTSGKNNKYLNKFHYPFALIKAKGYDTYASYSELTKKGFINNSTHDLTFIDQELSKAIPGSNMINGVMILPPKKKADRDLGNEDKFLKAIKIKE
jgi:hypothetical protein